MRYRAVGYDRIPDLPLASYCEEERIACEQHVPRGPLDFLPDYSLFQHSLAQDFTLLALVRKAGVEGGQRIGIKVDA